MEQNLPMGTRLPLEASVTDRRQGSADRQHAPPAAGKVKGENEVQESTRKTLMNGLTRDFA